MQPCACASVSIDGRGLLDKLDLAPTVRSHTSHRVQMLLSFACLGSSSARRTRPRVRSPPPRVSIAMSSKQQINEYLKDKEGMFPVDKPKWLTSYDVVHNVRKSIANHLRQDGVKVKRNIDVKCGHGGTLDPLATGVLVIAIGRACRDISAFLGGQKTYTAVAKLGAETDTFDSEGAVTREAPFEHVTEDKILSVIPTFTGEIEQRPPAYSALKVDGKPAYELARAGVEVDLKPRKVSISRLQLTGFDSPYFNLEVTCSGGTYIRTLIHDIAHALGSSAHMTDLRRSQQGPFTLDSTITYDEACSSERVFESIQEHREAITEYLRDAKPQDESG